MRQQERKGFSGQGNRRGKKLGKGNANNQNNKEQNFTNQFADNNRKGLRLRRRVGCGCKLSQTSI